MDDVDVVFDSVMFQKVTGGGSVVGITSTNT